MKFPVRYANSSATEYVSITNDGKTATINLPEGRREVKLPLAKVLAALGAAE